MDAAGAVKARLFTQVNLTATPSTTALVPYAESDLVLANQPAAAASLTFRYRPVGSTGGWTSTSFAKRGEGLFGRDFQNDNLLPGVITATSQYDYEYQYEALDAAGQVVNGATGSFRITPNAKQFLSHTGTRAPTVVSFVIEPQNALKMALRYRALDRNGVPVGDYSTVSLTRTSNKEPFRWNASTLTPASGSASYEYEYRLLDGAGNPVLNPVGEAIVVQGTATIGQVTQQVPQTTWVTTGSVSTANTIVRRQARNAFGEVQSETDGRGNTTTLAYNTLGQLVLKQDPLTDVTGENGVTTRATPQTRYVYDLAGRAVGTRDANGYWSTQVWQEGQAQPQIAREFHADSGRVERTYDVFGNLRSSTDAEGRQTRYRYDQNDQLTRVDRPARTAGQYLAGQAAWETYEYDSLGQRIAATTVLGRSRQYFDLQGRVSRTTSIEERSTRYAYTWDNTITGAGGRQVGGWLKTTTLSGGLTARDKSDVFGRMTWRQDYGNHVFSYGYNLAGWLMTQTSTLASAQGVQAQQNLGYEYYANGYVKKQTDFVTKLQSSYAYDDNGNRVFEEARRSDDANAVYYSSSISYDELNRVSQVKDQQYTITTKYDAAGNRRNVNSYYQDGVDGSQATQDLWYLYDPMNRFTVTMGQLKDGLITRGTTGKLIGYNKAGERMVAEYTADDGKTEYSERYTYTSDGYLQDMFRSIKAAGSSSFTVQTTPAATRQTDLAGRVLNYTERNADNSIRSNLGREYDRDNRQLKEYDYTLLKDGKPRTDTYGYNADGTLAQIVTTNTSDGTGLTRRYSYEWWDSAQQKSITLQAQNEAAPGWDKGTSLFTYDVNGHLVRATDVQGKRTIQYISDADGQILYRQEVAARNGVASDWHWFSDSDPSLGGEAVAGDVARKRHYYYLSGHRIGDVNNEGPQPNGVDYAEALAQSKTAEPTKFAPTAYANFDANYQAINESYPGPTGTDYTVQKGDTLQGIAERLWGDRSLWYLIAEANGLVGAESLTEGMRLEIPNKVTNVHNNSGTVGVYDAGAAIGDTSPTLPAPPPPPKQGCGTLGTIIMIAVAVVVTAYLGPIAGQAFGSLLGGAVTAAAASVASQGVGMAIGQQTEFSWKAVGQAALAGGIGGGLGASGLDVGGSAFGAGTWQAAATNAAMATGTNLALHGDWNWRSVMASAASSGLAGDPTRVGGIGLDWTSAAALGAQFAGNWVGNRIATGHGNPRAAWVQTAGQALGSVFASAAAGSGGKDSKFSPGQTDLVSMPDANTRIDNRSPIWSPEGSDFYQALVGAMEDPIEIDVSQGTLLAAAARTGYGPTGNETLDQALARVQANRDAFIRSNATGIGARIYGDGRFEQYYTFDQAPSSGGGSVRLGAGGLDTQPVASGDSQDRQEQLARIMRLANEPAAVSSAAAPFRVEINGVGSTDPDTYNAQVVWLANKRGEDLAPTVANAARLRLTAADGGLSGFDLAQRFGQGLVEAAKGVTVEPVLQLRDMGMALASVAYNELIRSDGDAHWLPEMKSGTSEAYANGASKTRLVLQSNLITGIGVVTYDLTTATMKRDWGTVAEVGGGLLGGFAIGKATSNYGGYGVRWAPGGIGSMSTSSQRGATTFLNFEPVTPRNSSGIVSFGNDLVTATGNWLKADTPTPIPLQVAQALKGQSFNTFGDLRSAVWRAIAADENLSGAFRQKSFSEIEAGRAPFAPPAFQNTQFGLKFNLHHVQSIAAGGKVYDLSNLRIVSPVTHSLLHGE